MPKETELGNGEAKGIQAACSRDLSENCLPGQGGVSLKKCVCEHMCASTYLHMHKHKHMFQAKEQHPGGKKELGLFPDLKGGQWGWNIVF